jgi:hypothetical protein
LQSTYLPLVWLSDQLGSKTNQPKTLESFPFIVISWWAHLPSSSRQLHCHIYSPPAWKSQRLTALHVLQLHFTCPSVVPFQVTTSQDWIFSEQSLTIIHAPALRIHVNQATPHIDISLISTLNCYWDCLP